MSGPAHLRQAKKANIMKIENSYSFDCLNGSNTASRSKVPFILLIISTIFILFSFLLIIVIATQVKDLKDKENNQNQEQSKKTGHAPIIGLTGKREPSFENETITMIEDPNTADEVRVHYIEAIERAGGIP